MNSDNERVYPYIPNSVKTTKESMKRSIGIESIDELFISIPDNLRFVGKMKLPDPIESEYALKKHMESILMKNTSCAEARSFLGAGCYNHYVPAICDEITNRSEFLTAYCGETYSDHGKLQAIFEYTSMMGELLDMDVVSYTTYDGGHAAATAIRMACRITNRREVLVPASMNPEIFSLLQGLGEKSFDLIQVAYDPLKGTLDFQDLKCKLSHQTAAIFIENPNFFGILEEEAPLFSEYAKTFGALFIVYADPSSLGLIEAPSNYGADITCGEIQGLGIHLQCGGGCAGYVASHDNSRFINEYPNYFYGIMKGSKEGEYGFGRALNDRTSHGSRENAKDYFGTGSGLWAITAGVYLALMGPKGMEDLASHILYKTHYSIQLLSQLKQVKSSRFSGYSFREFVMDFNETHLTVASIHKKLRDKNIFGGKDLSKDFPALGECALYCVTETTSAEDIECLYHALQEILEGGENHDL